MIWLFLCLVGPVFQVRVLLFSGESVVRRGRARGAGLEVLHLETILEWYFARPNFPVGRGDRFFRGGWYARNRREFWHSEAILPQSCHLREIRGPTWSFLPKNYPKMMKYRKLSP